LRENSKVYNIRLQYFGENVEILQSNLLSKESLFQYDKPGGFDIDEDTLYYIPSIPTGNGIGLAVKQSIVKFGHR